MTTITNSLEQAIADQINEDQSSPAAHTARLVDVLHRNLDTTREKRVGYVAETAVRLARIVAEADERMAEIVEREKALEMEFMAAADEHRRQMVELSEIRKSIGARAEAQRERVTAEREAQLSEIDRQIAMLDAALAAGATSIS